MEKLILNLGVETTDKEIDEILESFPSSITVDYEKNIFRLSADLLPLIISFSLGAIASGVFYDALKISLISLVKKFNDENLRSNSVIKINKKNRVYIISKEKIFMQTIEEEVSFQSIDDLLDKMKNDEKF